MKVQEVGSNVFLSGKITEKNNEFMKVEIFIGGETTKIVTIYSEAFDKVMLR